MKREKVGDLFTTGMIKENAAREEARNDIGGTNKMTEYRTTAALKTKRDRDA